MRYCQHGSPFYYVFFLINYPGLPPHLSRHLSKKIKKTESKALLLARKKGRRSSYDCPKTCIQQKFYSSAFFIPSGTSKLRLNGSVLSPDKGSYRRPHAVSAGNSRRVFASAQNFPANQKLPKFLKRNTLLQTIRNRTQELKIGFKKGNSFAYTINQVGNKILNKESLDHMGSRLNIQAYIRYKKSQQQNEPYIFQNYTQQKVQPFGFHVILDTSGSMSSNSISLPAMQLLGFFYGLIQNNPWMESRFFVVKDKVTQRMLAEIPIENMKTFLQIVPLIRFDSCEGFISYYNRIVPEDPVPIIFVITDGCFNNKQDFIALKKMKEENRAVYGLYVNRKMQIETKIGKVIQENLSHFSDWKIANNTELVFNFILTAFRKHLSLNISLSRRQLSKRPRLTHSPA